MTEVKDKLLSRIKTIKNERFLNNLLVLVENVDQNGIYQFTNEQKEDIDESIEQIEKGDYFSHKDVMNKFLL